MNGVTRKLDVLWLALVAAAPAGAADIAPAEAPAPVSETLVVPQQSSLQISATGYLWASSLSGRSASFPPLPAASVSLRFGDILKDLNGAVMGAAEARLDRFSVFTDVMIGQVTSGGDLPGPYFSRVQLK